MTTSRNVRTARMNDRIKETLTKARDLIEKKGLAKDVVYDPASGAFCSVGAVMMSSTDHTSIQGWAIEGDDGNLTCEAVERLSKFLPDDQKRRTASGWINVVNYNNDPATSAEDVLLVFKRAVADAP